MIDQTTSLPLGPSECTPAAAREAASVLRGTPAELFRQLLAEQEAEATLVAGRRVLAAFLPQTPAVDTSAVLADLAAAREAIAEVAAGLRTGPPQTLAMLLRQRAPLALLEGCWLDTLSQPATQPAMIVNRLGAEQFELLGHGVLERSLAHDRRRTLEQHGVLLPDLAAADFLTAAQARPLTVLTAVFHLALSRLPASFLPEVVGVYCAFRGLGTDPALYGVNGPGYDPAPLVEEYLALTEQSPTGAADRARLLAAIQLTVRLETAHVAMLDELAAWHQSLSLDARVATIIARHAPYAGRQHHKVSIAGARLSDTLADPAFDVAAVVRKLRVSSQLRPLRAGGCRFTRAIKFGGPMFGIFDDAEARTLQEWAAAVAAGEEPGADLTPCTAGDDQAGAWQAAVAASDPSDILLVEPGQLDERRFLYRLVNVERFPSVLAAARRRADMVLTQAEAMWEFGAKGRFTDASWFDYTPAALIKRVEDVYWTKLVEPFRPLAVIPPREDVINGQKRFALGSLIDGAWAHRLGNTGRAHRPSDGPLFAIYADEMGRGDVAKNHITLIQQVLRSMDIHLPHLREEAFLAQTELPDLSYPFATYQLSLALFPDTLYDQILGYNLGIEMFGLGELRLHEMQKMRHHRLDISYEEAHLSIDNVSAGHARQSADLIVGYLDHVGRAAGRVAVERAWRRIWGGYASFAMFVEPALGRRAMVAAMGRTP